MCCFARKSCWLMLLFLIFSHKITTFSLHMQIQSIFFPISSHSFSHFLPISSLSFSATLPLFLRYQLRYIYDRYTIDYTIYTIGIAYRYLVLGGCLPSKKSPLKAIFLAQSKIFHYLCNRFGKALPITTYFSIAL